MSTRQPKIYIAGPEVFLPNAREVADKQRRTCTEFGFIGIHPIDNNLDTASNGPEKIEIADIIYRGDIGQVEDSDIVVANCNPFRGVCIDDGTAYELGYGNALGKVSYGYIKELTPLVRRTVRDYPCERNRNGDWVDREGYLVTDDFETSINLMMQCGMRFRGGRLIQGVFRDAIRAIRKDLDSGVLVLDI